MSTKLLIFIASIFSVTFIPAYALECNIKNEDMSDKLQSIEGITSVTTHGLRDGMTSEDSYFYMLHRHKTNTSNNLDDVILVKEYNCVIHRIEITWHNQSEIDNKEIARIIEEIILSSNIAVIHNEEKTSKDLSEKLNKIDFSKPQNSPGFDSIEGIYLAIDSGIEVHILDKDSHISQSKIIYFYLNVGGLV